MNAWLKSHHAAKKTKYKIRSISEYCHEQLRDPPSEKERLLTRFQMQIKVTLIVKISFAKKIKAEESMTFRNIFSSMADFRHVVLIGAASSPTNKGK